MTRKITAEIAVIARTKLNTSAARIAGRSSGRITRRNVCQLLAPSVSELSSSDLSSCDIEAMPARTPTGMLRKMKLTTRMMPVPVSSIGGTLKARM